MTLDKLKEELAAIEHERWSDWQRYCHSKMTNLSCSPLYMSLPMKDYDHWRRQIATPYAELTEAEKQSDRNQVDRYWHLIDRYAQAVREEAYAAGYKQGKFDAEVTAEYGEPK